MLRSHARNRVHTESSTTNKIATTKMDPIKLHIRRSAKQTLNTRYNLLSVSLALILSAVALCSLFILFKPKAHVKRYGVIIDGGSTGTRIHVFSYQVSRNGPVFNFGEEGSAMKVNPGLTAYAEDPEGAGRSLAELMRFAKEKVPEVMWRQTEIRLMATAGMRLLDVEVQGKILDACRQVLRQSMFKFQEDWANVITGSDEGVYAWVVANYALGSLGGDPSETTGIIELGGASAQITFVSNEAMPPEFSRTVKFGDVTYTIYSHSFLHFGQNAASDTLRELLASGDYRLCLAHDSFDMFGMEIDHNILIRDGICNGSSCIVSNDAASVSTEKGIFIDPCNPKGYSHAVKSGDLSPVYSIDKYSSLSAQNLRGNFSKCRSAALTLLQQGKEKCSYQRCDIGSAFVPKLQGKFLATENFFHTSKFFGLGPKAFLSDLKMAGEHFCGEDWSRLKKKHQSVDDEDLTHYCFSSAYIVALLHDSLGIALEDDRISSAIQIGNTPLDWALGAFIMQSVAALDQQHPHWFANIISGDSNALVSLIAFAVLLTFMSWSVSKWRNPQLKTIYDLEKGRYIVTKLPTS